LDGKTIRDGYEGNCRLMMVVEKQWPLRIIVVLGHFGWENYQGRL
jgi:hypothetical protein